jgi:uncharacterized membrane protein YqaE (UPF0057 family)
MPSALDRLLSQRTGADRLFVLSSDICKIILAIILPPLGVFLERGCGPDLLINILLTILGYIPGIIHALYVAPPGCDPGHRAAPLHHHAKTNIFASRYIILKY